MNNVMLSEDGHDDGWFRQLKLSRGLRCIIKSLTRWHSFAHSCVAITAPSFVRKLSQSVGMIQAPSLLAYARKSVGFTNGSLLRSQALSLSHSLTQHSFHSP